VEAEKQKWAEPGLRLVAGILFLPPNVAVGLGCQYLNHYGKLYEFLLGEGAIARGSGVKILSNETTNASDAIDEPSIIPQQLGDLSKSQVVCFTVQESRDGRGKSETNINHGW
jgi:hypothetical protein